MRFATSPPRSTSVPAILPSVVRVGIEADDRDALLRDLVVALRDGGCLIAAEEALASVIDREQVQSTAIGGGIAFPHARTTHAPELVLAAARLARGVDFRAPDGEAVDLVFLLLGPPDDPGEHVRLLARLARLLRRDEVLVELRGAGSEQEFRAVIERESAAAV